MKRYGFIVTTVIAMVSLVSISLPGGVRASGVRPNYVGGNALFSIEACLFDGNYNNCSYWHETVSGSAYYSGGTYVSVNSVSHDNAGYFGWGVDDSSNNGWNWWGCSPSSASGVGAYIGCGANFTVCQVAGGCNKYWMRIYLYTDGHTSKQSDCHPPDLSAICGIQ